MKKHLMLVVGLMALIFNSCVKDTLADETTKAATDNETQIEAYLKTQSATFQKTSSGLRYNITNKTTGNSAVAGNEVTIQYSLSQLSGKFIDSTTSAKPLVFPFKGLRLLEGMEEAILMLKEGESGVFILPSALAYGNNTTVVPAWTVIKTTIKLVKVRTEEDQINEYIAAKKLVVKETTTTNLRIIQDVTYPDSTAITTGKSVQVKYTGSALDDVVFDAGTFTFTTGTNAVIKGFEEGILKMRKGEKATLIFPSAIGYSSTGSYNSSKGAYSILPYAPLRFDIEILSVK